MPVSNPTISIALVDDHTLFRKGIASLLKEFEEIEIVFEAGNGPEFQQLLQKHTLPDVLLMDIHMPVMDGYACTLWAKRLYPSLPILALSMYNNEKAIIKMLRAGAGGYILKESKPSELLTAIRGMAEKGFFINELVTGNLIHSYHKEEVDKLNNKNLSDREIELLRYCCSELTYKEIAAAMNLSPKTIDGHRDTLFKKLSITSRVGLAIFAIKTGIAEVV